MKKKNKIIISIIGIVLMVAALLGIAYAYYLTNMTRNSNDHSIVAETVNLRLVYDDNSSVINYQGVLMPGTVVGTKTFKVSNTGSKTISYGVYLEEIVNPFVRTEDLTFTLTCSGTNNTTCAGTSGAFPSNNKLLIENSIAPNIRQDYTLTISYANSNEDQAVDMGKSFSGKVNIYSTDAITMDFTTSIGTYAVFKKTPNGVEKKSYLKDNKYTFVGVDTGNYRLDIYDSNGSSISTINPIRIQKGNTNGVSYNTITIEYTGIRYSANLNNNATIVNGVMEVTNPYLNNTNLLAYHIINNAVTNANGTVFRRTPLTNPGYEVSAYNSATIGSYGTQTAYYGCRDYYDEYNAMHNNSWSLELEDWCVWNYYVIENNVGIVANEYPDITTEAQIDAINQVTQYSCTSNKVGKLIIIDNFDCWESEEEEQCAFEAVNVPKTIVGCAQNGEYLVASGEYEETETITSTEKELSITPDNYGDSYYFRGGVEDNYVNFANKCWRIVRIEGDGSIKLTLASSTGTCNTNGALTDDSAVLGIEWDSFADSLISGYGSKMKEDTIYYDDGISYNEVCDEENCVWDYDIKFRLTNASYGIWEANKYYPRLTIPTGAYIETDKVFNLTADELVFAGMKYNTQSYTYLDANAPEFSVYSWLYSEDDMIGVSSGRLQTLYPSYLRPTITLVAGTTISGGVGTKTNPYIVN